MPRRKSSTENSPPQISFTNWLLGGPLVTTNKNSAIERLIRANAAKAAKTAEADKAEEKKEGEAEKPTESPAEEEKKPEAEAVKEGEGEAKTDDKKEDKPSDEAKANEPNDSGFTMEQDEKILSMKAENKSWKIIATELGLAKQNVIKRFKELKDKEAKDKKDGKPEDKKDEKTEGQNGDGEKKDDAKDKLTENGSGATEGNASKSDTPPVQLKKLKPDNIWSQRDCELLEYLEARYDNEKWLNMQANFYNHTGRMVMGQLIESKFKQDGS